MKKISVAILGSGNVAAFLCGNLLKYDVNIESVISRNTVKGRALAQEADAEFRESFSPLENRETIIISAVKDSAAEEVWSKCAFGKNTVLHTAGALPLETLGRYAENCGVLYPLQSITSTKIPDSREVPFLIEANSKENLRRVNELASLLSPHVQECSSEKREKLHLAAVFANNFSNLCFRMAWELAEKEGIDPRMLLPLIAESCNKLKTLTPAEAQTGPAVRWDENVMQKHLHLLQDMPETAEFYRLASREIHRRTNR